MPVDIIFHSLPFLSQSPSPCPSRRSSLQRVGSSIGGMAAGTNNGAKGSQDNTIQCMAVQRLEQPSGPIFLFSY